ncbi:MAG: hypothetical protein IJI14_00100 [Anaerolineaceae bacterium]|nr:hypothetical protein [Anaerolineaceae bacterium]
MPDLPIYYNYINAANSQISPSTVHVRNSALAMYFRRYLLQRAMSVFKWSAPDYWNMDYFKYILYCWGYIAIVNTNEFGVIPQQCSLGGYNVFYAPTYAIIANPKLKGILQPTIDKQCTIIKLQPDYGGILDMVYYYADQLALCGEAVAMNIQNSKLGYVVGARSKVIAEAIKKAFDMIMQGEPLAVYDKELAGEDSPLFDTFCQNLAQNFIAPDISETMRRIENEFCTRIGINNTNTDKAERMVVDEVNANNEEVRTLADMWLESLKESCRKTRELFLLDDFDVEWRYSNEGRDNIPTGDI